MKPQILILILKIILRSRFDSGPDSGFLHRLQKTPFLDTNIEILLKKGKSLNFDEKVK